MLVSVNMFGTQNLGLFVASAVLLAITPGQDTLYIVGRSIAQGRRAGWLSVAGIISGVAVHTLLAAFGLSAIFAASAEAFTAVKWLGAAYLMYLGAAMLLERQVEAGGVALPRDSDWNIYRAALFTNLLNPKVALFFLAFLPQFVAPSAGSQVLPLLALGLLFIGIGSAWCVLLVWTASAASRHLRDRRRSSVLLKRVTGAVFMGLGLRLAGSR